MKLAGEIAAAKAAAILEPLVHQFRRQTALVFAPGPSLPSLWPPKRVPPCPSIAVNDAWEIVPAADALYAADAEWWRYHHKTIEYRGLRVGTWESWFVPGLANLEMSGADGFDDRLGWIRHGSNSGCGAIHLAGQLGARRIVLVGFDQRRVNGESHWFGEHPRIISRGRSSPYERWVPSFEKLRDALAARGVEVLNATPGSALTCFEMVELETICAELSAWSATSRITAPMLSAPG